MRRDLGREIAKSSRSAVKKSMGALLAGEASTIGEITESPPEYNTSETSTTPALNAVRALANSPLVAGTLQLIRLNPRTEYVNGVDFEEIPNSGSYRNQNMPVGISVQARYQYRESQATGIDHGTLTGRGDDDHDIYALADGTRLRVAPTSSIASPVEGQLGSLQGALVIRQGAAWVIVQATPVAHSHDAATDLASGFMSAQDKSLLGGLLLRVAGLEAGGPGGGAAASGRAGYGAQRRATRMKLGGY